MAQSDLIAMLFKTCNYERWEEDICHYTLNLNNTKHISADDMIIGGLSPEIVRSIVGLLLAMLLYIVLTIVTFGIKVPSGLFIPSMTVGAIFGRLIGLGIQQFVLNFNHWSVFSSYCGEGQGNSITKCHFLAFIKFVSTPDCMRWWVRRVLYQA